MGCGKSRGDHEGAGCCKKCGTCCRFFLIFLMIGGMVLSGLACAECEFLKLEGRFGGSGASGEFGVGLYRGDPLFTDTCDKYDSDFDFNASFTTARICAIIAPCFAFVAFIFACLELFFCGHFCCSRVLNSILMTCAWICQALTYLIYNGRTCSAASKCSWGLGSTYSVIAVVLFAIASFIACCSPSPRALCCKKDMGE